MTFLYLYVFQDAESSPAAAGTSTPGSAEESESVGSVQIRDSGIEEEACSERGHDPNVVIETEAQSVCAGPHAIGESKSEEQNKTANKTASSVPTAKNVNVKDILRSLVSAPADGATGDPTVLPPAFLGVLGDATAAEPPVQFRSFDR